LCFTAVAEAIHNRNGAFRMESAPQSQFKRTPKALGDDEP
jgi:hypothetical protein